VIPKRVFWLTVGYGAGIGSSWYAARKVKAAARRYTPDGLADRVSGSVSGASAKVRAAVAEGRDAMHRREAELRGAASGGAELRGDVASQEVEPARRSRALGEPNRRGARQPVR